MAKTKDCLQNMDIKDCQLVSSELIFALYFSLSIHLNILSLYDKLHYDIVQERLKDLCSLCEGRLQCSTQNALINMT